MAPTWGSITGTVAEDVAAHPVAGAWVIAVNASAGAPGTGAATDGSGLSAVYLVIDVGAVPYGRPCGA